MTATHDPRPDCPCAVCDRWYRERSDANALRERIAHLEAVLDCGTNALRDSVLASGNDPKTNLHWVNKMRRDAGLDPTASPSAERR